MRPSWALLLILTLAPPAPVAVAGPVPSYSYRVEARADGFTPAVGAPVGGGPEVFAATITGAGSLSATFRTPTEWGAGEPGGGIGLGTVGAGWAADPGAFAASFGAADVGGTYSGAYTLEVWLRDEASRELVLFAFRGLLSGGVAVDESGGVTSTIRNELTGGDSQARTVGDRRYTVALAGAPALAERPGEFRARVSVETIAEAPEPASAALALAGLVGAGGWWVRFRVPSSRARVLR